MTYSEKLAGFDIDGTVKNKEGIPQEVIDGITHLWGKNILTTFLTARGYQRLHAALKPNADRMISTGVPLGLEGGGRLTLKDGTKVTYNPLVEAHREAAIAMLQEGGFSSIFYYPEEVNARPVVWSADKATCQHLAETETAFADVLDATPGQFARRFAQDKPCMLAVRHADNTVLTDRRLQGFHIVANESWTNLTAQNVHKGSALVEIANYLDLQTKGLTFAGNDFNDVPAFEVAQGGRIFVGNNAAAMLSVPEPFIHVANPQELGMYLQQL